MSNFSFIDISLFVFGYCKQPDVHIQSNILKWPVVMSPSWE